MGSLFSALQFITSPYIGSLSDKHGRKRILLLTMIGNILSALVWIQSTSFASYVLSRVIGGLSEGNVQLAIAVISDVSSPSDRSRSLAAVGIAFAICFCVGPPVGAYFASRPFPPNIIEGVELNIYATPAALTLVLLLVETAFLAVALPETRHTTSTAAAATGAEQKPTTKTEEPPSITTKRRSSSLTLRGRSVESRIKILRLLSTYHFLFLGIFSGVEFTLTFLTFDLFDWNNKQNGALIGSIGIISALLQGGYVRRATPKVGEGIMARRGVQSCALGLVLLAIVPQLIVSSHPTFAVRFLWAAAVCMAYTSATVVTSLTSYASLQCDDSVDKETGKPVVEHPDLVKGRALGKFRSRGQLGRALGPLIACASYWTFGPTPTYFASAITMLLLSIGMGGRSIDPT